MRLSLSLLSCRVLSRAHSILESSDHFVRLSPHQFTLSINDHSWHCSRQDAFKWHRISRLPRPVLVLSSLAWPPRAIGTAVFVGARLSSVDPRIVPSYRRLKLARASGRARAFVLPKNFVSDSQKRSRLFLGFAGGSKTPGRTRDAPLLPEVYHRVSLSHGHPTFRPFRIPLNSSDPGWLAKPHHPSPNLRERRERRQRSLQPWERSAAR